MSSASTQFEDERRLQFMMQKRHREAALAAEIRRARSDMTAVKVSHPSTIQRIVANLGAMLKRTRPTVLQVERSPEPATQTSPD